MAIQYGKNHREIIKAMLETFATKEVLVLFSLRGQKRHCKRDGMIVDMTKRAITSLNLYKLMFRK